MVRRSYLQYLPIPADNAIHQFTLNTPDGDQVQTIDAVWVGATTAGLEVSFGARSRQATNVDCAYFAAGNRSLPFDLTVDVGLQPQVWVQDHTSTGNATLPVMIEYTVPRG